MLRVHLYVVDDDRAIAGANESESAAAPIIPFTKDIGAFSAIPTKLHFKNTSEQVEMHRTADQLDELASPLRARGIVDGDVMQ